ncbi:hypothetical protein [Rhodococcus sp. IEGM 1408]|uniref:hypothetical protein n=1 Tax=Rhodococcus sp. IEGM 1408 TaxID=3082220 RepID=UPI0029555923|nr:hypothetical protein [Rhodococcus sp. IEGM 1408]MDV8001532.1 hypothetical protein [Rhodococcus sp. IEGM 1408]
MTARRYAVLAVAAAVLAAVLWWLSRDLVPVEAPAVDPPARSPILRTYSDPWLLLAATVSAGVAIVSATLAVLRVGAPK